MNSMGFNLIVLTKQLSLTLLCVMCMISRFRNVKCMLTTGVPRGDTIGTDRSVFEVNVALQFCCIDGSVPRIRDRRNCARDARHVSATVSA